MPSGSEKSENLSAAEKRRKQRVRLYSPLQAEIDSSKATVVDISSEGARIEHKYALPVGKEVTLEVTFEELKMPLRALVVRCRMDKSINRDAIVYQTGLRFTEPESESVLALVGVLRELINYDLDARKRYTSKRASR